MIEKIRKSVFEKRGMDGKLAQTRWGVLAVVCLLLMSVGGLMARYISSNEKQAEMVSSQFHISSDYLEEDAPSYGVVDWGNGILINLYNYEKENVAQISATDIKYKVTVTGGTYKVYDADGEEVSAVVGMYTLPVDDDRYAQQICVMPDEPGTVTVTLETTSPYKKSLSATFAVTSKQVPDYTIEDQDDGTVKITIETNDYENGITVIWDSSLFSPDNTNVLMESWQDSQNPDNTVVAKALAVTDNATYELIFFKKTEAAYSKTTGSGTTIGLGVSTQ